MAKIAVLFHEFDHKPERFVVHRLAEVWRSDGHEVCYLHGTKYRVPADILLVHIDLSVVPRKYQKFAEHYPKVINGKILDIRKSRISRQRLASTDHWDGPVIVKSDLNYGGIPEVSLGLSWMERRCPLFKLAKQKLTRIGNKCAPSTGKLNYQIFAGIQDVPLEWFASREVIVEKFLPEIENGLYHLRIFQSLGKRWTCTRLSSPEPIIKARRSVRVEEIKPHPAVELWRREHELDYGKIDYVICEGEPVLLDINKTTGTTTGYRSEESLRVLRRYLAEGIYDYF